MSKDDERREAWLLFQTLVDEARHKFEEDRKRSKRETVKLVLLIAILIVLAFLAGRLSR